MSVISSTVNNFGLLQDSQKPADTSGVNTSSNLSYCEQVSREEYEEQRRNIAHDALLKLLDSIVDDPLMSPKSKSRRLQQVSSQGPSMPPFELVSPRVSFSLDVSTLESVNFLIISRQLSFVLIYVESFKNIYKNKIL